MGTLGVTAYSGYLGHSNLVMGIFVAADTGVAVYWNQDPETWLSLRLRW